MTASLLGSTLLMVILLAVVFVGASRIDSRTSGTGESGPPARRSASTARRISTAVDTPAGLGGAFVLIAVTAGALTVAAVGGLTTALPDAYVLTMVLFGLLLSGFLFAGTYVVVRQHGLGHAQGVAAGLLGLGGVGILLIAANLVFGFA